MLDRRFFNLFVGTLAFCLFIVPETFSSEPPQKPSQSVFRGTSHVHTEFSHDSGASLSLVIQEAEKKGLDFVVVTDHNSLKGAAAYGKMNRRGHPLLIFGDEVSAPDGHLIALGISEEPPAELDSQALIDWIHARGGYAILPHPFGDKNPWKNWQVRGWDGLEIYNFGHGLFSEGGADFALEALFGDPIAALPTVQKIPREHFSFWDNLLKERPVSAVAGTDAHLKHRTANFLAALQSVTLYVIAGQLEEKEIIEAMGRGKVFMAFETRGKASDFSFWAEAGGQIFGLGETILGPSEVSFHVHLPSPAKIRLIRDGSVVAEQETQELIFPSDEAGAYRVEVYREEDLWIFSNPIYMKASEVNKV